MAVTNSPFVPGSNTSYYSVVSAKAPRKGTYLIRITAWLKFTSNRINWRITKGGTEIAPGGGGSVLFGQGPANSSFFHPLTAAIQADLEAGEELALKFQSHSQYPITQVGQCILELCKIQ